MNIAIGLWALVLGGVLIPGGDQSVGQPGGPSYQAPSVDFGSPLPGAGGLGTGPGSAGWGLTSPAWSPGLQESRQGGGGGLAPSYPSAPYGEPPQVNRQSTPQDLLVPFAPTDPSAASRTYPWGPPTAGGPPEGEAAGQPPVVGSPSTGDSGSQLLSPGAYVRPSPVRPAYRGYSPYSPYGSLQAPAPRSGVGGPSPYSPMARIPKPHGSYRPPSAVSPYMELGRIPSLYDDIDNYNQYVLPKLQRREAAQQTATEITGLQNAVRRLSRETQSVRGVAIPQYYMNYGGYYPGLQK